MTVDVPFFWVDAFTDRPFGGNPAGVCLLDRPADPRWMQRLAFELGLSETAYLWPGSSAGDSDGDDHRWSLRWFTPTIEVDLCGHATLASAQALRDAGRAVDGQMLSFTTRSGLLTARLGGDVIELDLPAATPRPVDPPPLPAGWPVVAAFEGGDDLVVELPDAAAVRSLVPDPAIMDALPYRAVVVTAAGDGPEGDGPAGDGPEGDGVDYVLRVFGCGVGIEEDPVTGSAQCALGPYWAGRLGRTVLQAAQLSARAGRLRVTVAGDRVGVAGGAVTVLRGTVTGPSPDGR
ncbi:MAG TPA: PhzF family phenazine biosynthesis isomerase [Acidimicrobiales bacterium]|nr:PhzF family phenazine biosynthesis isomerase [Acidimicrobiales bacterium]